MSGCDGELDLLDLMKVFRNIYRAGYAGYAIQGGVVSDRSGGRYDGMQKIKVLGDQDAS